MSSSTATAASTERWRWRSPTPSRSHGGSRDVTSLEAVVSSGDQVLGSTVGTDQGQKLPARRGTVTAAGVDYRGASYDAPGFDAQASRVTVLEPASLAAGDQKQSRSLIILLLLGFMLVALTLAWFVARSLHGQLGSFLYAARRIGSGDYSSRVPTVGRDDFAALGEEFNKMSAELEAREHDLVVERERLRRALGRLGRGVRVEPGPPAPARGRGRRDVRGRRRRRRARLGPHRLRGRRWRSSSPAAT